MVANRNTVLFMFPTRRGVAALNSAGRFLYCAMWGVSALCAGRADRGKRIRKCVCLCTKYDGGAWQRLCTMYEVRFEKFPRLRANVAEPTRKLNRESDVRA